MMLSWPLYGVFGRYRRLLLERLEFAADDVPYASLRAVVAVHLL